MCMYDFIKTKRKEGSVRVFDGKVDVFQAPPHIQVFTGLPIPPRVTYRYIIKLLLNTRLILNIRVVHIAPVILASCSCS